MEATVPNGRASAASPPKVLLLGKIELAHAAFEALTKSVTIVTPKSTNRDDFLAESRSGAFDGCKVAYRNFDSFSITGPFDATVLDALPNSLRFICHCGAGYDQIDVPACTERGIRVSNTPSAVDDATADTGIFLLLGALRNFNSCLFTLRRGEWRGSPPPELGHDPRGKILGFVGFGGIGQNMAAKARHFGLQIRYFKPNRLSVAEEERLGATYVDFDTLLAESDIISLNLRLNETTRHIISEAEFRKMKKGVVIINTARGAVIDEVALVNALDQGQVSSAGLDVYEDEPSVHPGLIKNDRCMLLPHMGTYTSETERKMEEWALDNVVKAVKSGVLRSIVPEQQNM
ncbi:D-isomer specific 2-hydroxyacid dehydrogenase [Echria macrotheca]|uniref:D-isomer specific 2-hydroxyacid dehydrogenase n=1 Tax=Echria macrotheca TaxID=438768 RepID=A0AAJ0FEU6_9PEZI|nr:D-isomer specific 2-hydroxyacid dehydrogenase [Echria macrotheca]